MTILLRYLTSDLNVAYPEKHEPFGVRSCNQLLLLNPHLWSTYINNTQISRRPPHSPGWLLLFSPSSHFWRSLTLSPTVSASSLFFVQNLLAWEFLFLEAIRDQSPGDSSVLDSLKISDETFSKTLRKVLVISLKQLDTYKRQMKDPWPDI